MGAIANVKNGEEDWQVFRSSFSKKDMCQYDYRYTNGKLFSCVKPTLEECREARDEWLKEFD